MEDIHWADESIAILKELSAHLSENDAPILIVATFRDDERPDLPETLSAMRLMRLRRLDTDGISQLSASMLGANKTTPDLLALLERETEGNVLFLVETLRALAETAGSLSEISEHDIPARVMAGGVQAILRRRLERAPADAQKWIKLASVAGRQIDPKLMRHVGLDDLDGWLTVCANVAILDTADGQWRFSHDKLRETALNDLTADERPALHRQVAEGIEAVYPNEFAFAPNRMAHWRAANEPWKELLAAHDTADYWFTLGKFEAIKTMCADVLARLPAPQTDEQKKNRALINMYMGYADEPLGNYERAADVIRESLRVFVELDDLTRMASCYNALGAFAHYTGDLAAALDYFTKGVEIRRRETDFPLGLANALASLGIHYDLRDDFENAARYYTESLAICEANDIREQMAHTLVNLGKLSMKMGALDIAAEQLERVEKLAREISLERVIGVCLVYRSELALLLHDVNAAAQYIDEAKAISERLGDRETLVYALTVLAQVAEMRGEAVAGLGHIAEAVETARAIKAPRQVAEARLVEGFLRLQQCGVRRAVRNPSIETSAAAAESLNGAQAAFTEALSLARSMDSPVLALMILVGFAHLRLLMDDIDGAVRLRTMITAHPRSNTAEVRARLAALDLALIHAGTSDFAAQKVDLSAIPTDPDLAAAYALLKVESSGAHDP